MPVLPHSPWQLCEIPSLTHRAHGYSNLLSICLSHSIRNRFKRGWKKLCLPPSCPFGFKASLKEARVAGRNVSSHVKKCNLYITDGIKATGPEWESGYRASPWLPERLCGFECQPELKRSKPQMDIWQNVVWREGDGLRAVTTRNLL